MLRYFVILTSVQTPYDALCITVHVRAQLTVKAVVMAKTMRDERARFWVKRILLVLHLDSLAWTQTSYIQPQMNPHIATL